MGGQTLPQFAPAPLRYYNDVVQADGAHWSGCASTLLGRRAG